MFIKLLVALTFVGMVIVNWMANALPINGRDTGSISDSYPNLFAPAGLTFAIWGLIYLLLALYTLYQFGLFQSDRGAARGAMFRKIGIYFIITSVANSLWIFSWHYDWIGVSVLLTLVLLYFLIKIADVSNKQQYTPKEKLFILAPFSVYFGWITVATIANITVFLVSIGWDGFGISDVVWTVAILVVGAIIGTWRMLKDRNLIYGVVLVWAYLGILIKHLSASGFNGQYPFVIGTAIACIIAFLVAGISVVRNRKQI